MEIVAHRINLINELLEVPVKYGCEIDIRSQDSKLILNHEPYFSGDSLVDYLDNYKHGYNQNCPDKPTLLKIDNIAKPLKSISSYKVGELTEMCEQLKISITNDKTCKNKNKNELYESIAQYF